MNQRLARSIVITAYLLTLLASHSFAEDSVVLKGPVFGTTYTVKARGPSIDKEKLASAITERLEQIDARMSTWRDDSDVSRFNASRSTEWIPVHSETALVVTTASVISRETGGAFDITVGPAVRLWNFGAAAEDEFVLPTEEQIESARAIIGYKKLGVRLDPPALRKSNEAKLEIDLSAIAKGYAVDAVSELLVGESIEHYMVEIGGEVRVLGKNRDGSPWRIGLEAPSRGVRDVDSIVSLKNESLATSGDYRNFFEHEGVTYSHTLDPTMARPVTHNVAAVTVIAPNCMTTDAYATAILALGPVGLEWAEKNNIKALLTTRTGDAIERTATSNFPSINIQPTKQDADAAGRGNFFQLFLVTAAVFGIAIIAMSIGTIIANRRLQGSCGGMAGLKDAGGKTICDMCTKPSPECSGDPEATQPFSESG